MATTAVERAVRIVIPDGCIVPSISFGTTDPAVMHRIADEYCDADGFRVGTNYVTWDEDQVRVQVSYVGSGDWQEVQPEREARP